MELQDFDVSFPVGEESGGKGDFKPVEPGLYWVNIKDIRPKSHPRGPMFGIMTKVTEDTLHGGKYDNRIIWTNVIFLPYFSDEAKTKVTPGAGIVRKFLKAINQEYKGEHIKVSPKAWLGQSLGVRVTVKNNKENVVEFLNQEEYRKALETPKAPELPEEAIF